jgi:hypothetical protein
MKGSEQNSLFRGIPRTIAPFHDLADLLAFAMAEPNVNSAKAK